MPTCPVTKLAARSRLRRDYGFTRERAERVLNIAWEFESKAEPCEGGYVHVYYEGRGGVPDRPDLDGEHMFTVIDHRMSPDERAEFAKRRMGLAYTPETRYTHRKQTRQSGGSREGKDKKMARTAAAAKPATPARRGRRPAPQPDPEPEQNGALDVDRFLTKPFTATMEDYVEWFETEVTDLKSLRNDLPRILVLGVQLYGPYFQKSDFNVERREQRRAERAAEREPEPQPATTRTRGRKPAAATTEPATATPARRGRKPAAQDEAPATTAPRRGRPPKSAAAPAKPASTRGRGRKPAADSGADSPF